MADVEERERGREAEMEGGKERTADVGRNSGKKQTNVRLGDLEIQ